ncbi:MAG: hypothetical protein QXT85_00045 [Nanopusillaceae archaeon]
MRGWIVLFETIVSIIILTTAYLVFINYVRNRENIENISFKLNIENFRNFVEDCYPEKIYVIYNISSGTYIVCLKGNLGDLEDIKNYTFYGKYLFSGYKQYDPFILILYK